jgi:hypothetical protein
MNILDALRLPIFGLPKKYQNSFPEFLEETFQKFLSTIDQIDEGTITEKIKGCKDSLKRFCDGIIQSTRTYYSGFPAKSYFEFENVMEITEDSLFPSKSGGKYGTSPIEPFYRARVGTNRLFERKDLFHVPFELREIVTTQRFSVPGLPCLYLANSTFVCWEELRRPDINKMQVSRFQAINPALSFLDLSLTPSRLFEILNASTKEIYKKDGTVSDTKPMTLDSWDSLSYNYIMRWPLIAACSVKVKRGDGTFKPEYIFPQFLLQWVTTKKGIDGIKYFSIEAYSSVKVDLANLVNYAIPIKHAKPEGYCEKLVESFKLTQPTSWEIMTIADPNVIQNALPRIEDNSTLIGHTHMGGAIEFIKGKKTQYWQSIFGKIEIELASMEFDKI